MCYSYKYRLVFGPEEVRIKGIPSRDSQLTSAVN